ncbi:cupin domain-containing protein [Agaribacterium sp. ZY112]|uniref:cupin domain-containing protein n=1 Tax=Agaribacterium sp. ZY112 TaxID=3233574 RepID=UPI0035231430
MDNIFSALPGYQADEQFVSLLKTQTVHIERIVSLGHCSEPGFWYEQEHNEWVILLSGSAVLEFDGGSKQNLIAGSYMLIPAGRRHRVHATAKGEQSVWLAVHY